MALILGHAPAPWSPSGIRHANRVVVAEAPEMGHEVVLSTFWGLRAPSPSGTGSRSSRDSAARTAPLRFSSTRSM